MKIFAVYAKLDLVKKPDWLDDFRLKYDKPYFFHLTLKQPCFIEEPEIPVIKDKLSKFFDELILPNHAINLIFDELITEKVEGKGFYIMIGARRNEDIFKLQSQVKGILVNYKNYKEPETKAYEDNFKPHITIARQLNGNKFSQAKTDLKNDYTCEGVITEIVLSVIKEDTLQESNNPENLTVYRL